MTKKTQPAPGVKTSESRADKSMPKAPAKTISEENKETRKSGPKG